MLVLVFDHTLSLCFQLLHVGSLGTQSRNFRLALYQILSALCYFRFILFQRQIQLLQCCDLCKSESAGGIRE